MAIPLAKGGNISLSKTDPSLDEIMVGLGWNTRSIDGKPFDLDASAFLLKADGKVGILENPYFLSISAAILIGQILIVTFGGQAFRVMPLSAGMWITLTAVTSMVLWIGEIGRFVARAGISKTSAAT